MSARARTVKSVARQVIRGLQKDCPPRTMEEAREDFREWKRLLYDHYGRPRHWRKWRTYGKEGYFFAKVAAGKKVGVAP